MDSRPLHTLLRHLRRAATPEAGELTDAELLTRFVRWRDAAAFEVLVWRHGPLVWNICSRVLHQAPDVEDAFQATFLMLVRKASSIGRHAALAGWLHRVALRIALRARAQSLRRATVTLSEVLVPAVQAKPDNAIAEVLDDEVRRLPEKYRVPFILCHLQGLTYAEAARQLRCPEGTLAIRLSRARERLRRRLTARGIALSTGFAFAFAAASNLSAQQVSSTVRAGLAYTAGQTAAAGIVSTVAVTLTEGVLHTMFLTKLSVAAGLLLGTTMLGGAGVLTYRAVAAEPAMLAADDEFSAQAAPRTQPQGPTAAEQDRAKQHQERARQMEVSLKQLNAAEQQFQALEEKWTMELIEARMRIVEMQERIRRRERLQAREDAMLQIRFQSVEEEMKRTERTLQDAKAKYQSALDQLGSTHPKSNQLVAEIRALTDAVARSSQTRNDHEVEYRKREEQQSEESMRYRRELVKCEEDLRRIERQQEMKRESARRDLAAQEERVRELRGAEVASNPAGRPDLERKLDQMLRELSELRQELKRQPERRRDEP